MSINLKRMALSKEKNDVAKGDFSAGSDIIYAQVNNHLIKPLSYLAVQIQKSGLVLVLLAFLSTLFYLC